MSGESSPPRDDPFTLYVEKIAESDSGLYYSLLFAPAPLRGALTPLYTFWHEVRATLDVRAEAQVALAKLAWWRDETREMLAGRPRHPITRALAPVAARYELDATLLEAPTQALARRAMPTPYESYDALLRDGALARGSIERLAARIAGLRDPVVDDVVAEIGARLESTALLRDVGADAARQRCYLPLDDLARLGVTVDDLYAGRTTEAAGALIATHARRLRAEIEAQLARLDPRERASLRSLLAAAEIARHLLRQIEASAARMLRERPRLAPIRQLFTAWRASRRAVRGRHSS